MKEDNDAKEKELVAIKLAHKRLTLQHTVLVSDHEMFKIKFSDTSGNAPNSYEQYQSQIDDWHNKFNAGGRAQVGILGVVDIYHARHA